MRVRVTWGIRARLLCLVFLFGFVPAMAFLVHSGREQPREAIQEARRQAAQLSLLAAQDHARDTEGTRRLLATVAQLPQIQSGTGKDCDFPLAELLKNNQHYLNLAVTDSSGNLISSALPYDGPMNLSDRAWFRRSAATRDFAVGEYQIGRVTHQPSLDVGYPVIDARGRVQKYIFAALSLGWLDDFARYARLPRGTAVLVIDGNGTVLARHPDQERWAGRSAIDTPAVREILAGGGRTFRTGDPDGVERLWAGASLSGGGDPVGHVAVGLPMDFFLAKARGELFDHILELALLCLFALLTAWFGGNAMIVSPVKAVLRTARRLSEGDFEARTGVRPGRGELSQLANTVDEMAAALKEHQAEAQRAYGEAWESTERFRVFMDNSPVVAFMKDEQGRFVYLNEPFQRVFQIRLEEWRGKTDYEVLPPDTARQDTENDRAVLEADECREFIEIVPTPDGKPHTWLVFKFPVRETTGRRFLGGVALDITTRQRLEEQLRQAQKMEALGRLAGGIAHDFNNVLTAISGFGQLMSSRLAPGDPGRKDIDEILKAAGRATTLTRQLLSFSRQEVVQPRVLDLNVVIADLSKMLRRLIGSDVELQVILGARSAWVKADPGQLEQVIMNLAVNARDAMPTGGRLTIETTDAELDGSTASGDPSDLSRGSYAVLAVCDTGIGMDAETQARIFEPFFTTKEPGKGTGLGLSTVYGIVQQSAGAIQVSSQLGFGTKFRIFLPRVEAPVGGLGHAATEGRFPRGSETVLAVEDQEIVGEVVRAVLERSGYAVLEARESARALEICETYPGPIHLLLTDVVLPGLRGPELARRVVAARPETAVLYMSGHAGVEPDSLGASGPPGPLLRKPFQPEALAHKVREVLDGRPAPAA